MNVDYYKMRLLLAPRRARTALGAACAGRAVSALLRAGESDHVPATLLRSIDFGWTYALAREWDASEVAAIAGELNTLAEGYRDEGIELAASTISVGLHVLQSGLSDELGSLDSVARALTSALNVAHILNRSTVMALDEDKWQRLALSRVAYWNEPVQRTMFDSL